MKKKLLSIAFVMAVLLTALTVTSSAKDAFYECNMLSSHNNSEETVNKNPFGNIIASNDRDEDDNDDDDKDKDDNIAIIIGGIAVGVIVIGLIVFLVLSTNKSSSNGYASPSNNNMFTPSNIGRNRICLSGKGGKFNGKKFEVIGTVVIGRIGEKCNICYPSNEKGISGLHCKIYLTGNGAEVVDLGSTYGTYINGRKLQMNVPVSLNYGDELWIANEKNRFIVCS